MDPLLLSSLIHPPAHQVEESRGSPLLQPRSAGSAEPWLLWPCPDQLPPAQTKAKATAAPAPGACTGVGLAGRAGAGKEAHRLEAHSTAQQHPAPAPPSWTPTLMQLTAPLGLLFKDGIGKEAEMGPAQASACFWKNRSKSACPEPWASQCSSTGVVSGPQEATCPRNVLCGPGPLPPASIHVQMTLFPCSLKISP